MKVNRWGFAAIALVAVAGSMVALTSCTTARVNAGQTAIIVDDYVLIPTDPAIIECVQEETSEIYGSVDVYRYPARQISWDATGETGAERDPYVVVSNARAPAELLVPVSVTFDLTTDCDKLKSFHREFGTKYQGWLDDDGQPSEGWKQLLNYVVGQPLEQTLIRLSQKYTWQQVWNDEAIRVEFQNALQQELPNASKARTNGQDYFSNFQVTVLKPEPRDEGLKEAIIAEQKAIADARATEAKGVADANAKKAAAEAETAAAASQTELARQRALQQAAEISGYPSVDDYLRAKAIEAGQNPYQPTYVVPQGG